MGDSRDTDVKRVVTAGDDLVKVLKEKRDINSLTQCLEQSKSLISSCDSDFNEVYLLLKVISNELNDLERQRLSVQEQKQTLQKHEQDDLRVQMMLSMYASVTKIIPNLDDQSKISGYIVDREREEFEKFEYDPSKMTSFDVCNDTWKMVNS
ncbi:hypothetical protein L6164_001945 [Bauhinia variegata]|uniref:Uncharacterized protein n=1 Tax=Bauhinia variegata TaxID=167791 RepID=A0ACB9QBQ4_BAUVA|nr:hypothetical protein L6164_001945 [Bauhinia variegata]